MPGRRVYVFSDEAGNFDFSKRPGASKYFILGTVTTTDPGSLAALIDLRRDLAWDGAGLESCFHAAEDTQLVRDHVFRVIDGLEIRADFTIFEKSKTVPHRQRDEALYKLAWFEHFKHVGPHIVARRDDLLVIAASIGTRKRRRAIRLGVEDVVIQAVSCNRWEVAFWPSESDPGLQVADYCTWAVQRKWERGDDRSYNLIRTKIRTEYDFFQFGSRHYY
jgi:hypothetical protein